MAKQKKTWYNKYENLDELGEGGNARVYHVKCKTNNKDYALKDLTILTTEKKHRFNCEIDVMNDNFRKIEGIIPIVEFSTSEYWYTMPIAKPAIHYIVENKFDIKNIIEKVIQLCTTLEELHKKDISHRDIKPSNIYYYKNRFYFGDFGLVEFPDNINHFTRSDKGLGAIFTIAPEMKRNPKEADGKKADVFSLAKTLWMFLSEDEKGFDGVYNYLDSSHSLRFINKYKDTHLVELEELLTDATNNNPNSRPTIETFKEKLNEWLEIFSDSDKSQASDWNFINKQLFGFSPPESSSWRKVDKIIDVLNIVGSTPAYNHMLFHDNGGFDFSHAESAAEDGCIKLYDTNGFCCVVKPKVLYFEGFDEKYKWNYFLLELDKLNPIFENTNYYDSEYLVEDSPSHYVSARYANYGVYDYDEGNLLPKRAQLVNRYTKGKFLFVLKRGPYNRISGTYDGRHADSTVYEFRKYINDLIKTISELRSHYRLKNLKDVEIDRRIFSLTEVNKNPFKSSFVEQKNNNEIEEKIAQNEKSKEYIRKNYNQWNFKTILQRCEFSSLEKIKFVFIFNLPDIRFSLEMFNGINNYICNDGYIYKMSLDLDKKCYFVYNRELAISLKNKFKQKISEFLKENRLQDLDEFENCVSIKLIKLGKPTHLFTKQEIEEEMKKADDRVNNQLIIDENGYAKVIKNHGHGYLFPVRYESWGSGNLYVGKYSNLSTLDDVYISLLQGWLLYLKTGEGQYIDYIRENKDEEKLLKEIKEYY